MSAFARGTPGESAPPIEQGEPAADPRGFRRCLGQYPTGVTLVTTCCDGQPVAMVVNSFAAVSLDPPLVLWSIRRESRHRAAFRDAGHFAVNILAVEDVGVAQRFAASDPDRYSRSRWHSGRGGAPLLDGALVHLECRRESVHEGGDHLILVGFVERCSRFEGAPLVFSQGRYAVSQAHPAVGERAGDAPVPEPARGVLATLLSR